MRARRSVASAAERPSGSQRCPALWARCCWLSSGRVGMLTGKEERQTGGAGGRGRGLRVPRQSSQSVSSTITRTRYPRSMRHMVCTTPKKIREPISRTHGDRFGVPLLPTLTLRYDPSRHADRKGIPLGLEANCSLAALDISSDRKAVLFGALPDDAPVVYT